MTKKPEKWTFYSLNCIFYGTKVLRYDVHLPRNNALQTLHIIHI